MAGVPATMALSIQICFAEVASGGQLSLAHDVLVTADTADRQQHVVVPTEQPEQHRLRINTKPVLSFRPDGSPSAVAPISLNLQRRKCPEVFVPLLHH